MKPEIQFLELIANNPESIFKMYIIREENRKNGVEPIMKYYKDSPSDEGNILSLNLNGNNSLSLFGERESIKTRNKKKNKKLFK